MLRITQVTGPEAGAYTCTAENVAGRATLAAALVIQEPPAVTLQPAGSVRVVVGTPLRLRCEVRGDPRPSLVWRRIGQQGPREVARATALYEVLAVGRADEGTYACMATSPAGEVEERVQVIVIEEDEATGAGGGDGNWPNGGGNQGNWETGGTGGSWQSGGGSESGGSWQGGIGPQDFVVVEGGDLELRADVVGAAGGITILWRRQDGRPIGGRHRQRGSSLYIYQAARADSGVYVCEGADTRGNTVFQFLANLIISEALQVSCIHNLSSASPSPDVLLAFSSPPPHALLTSSSPPPHLLLTFGRSVWSHSSRL